MFVNVFVLNVKKLVKVVFGMFYGFKVGKLKFVGFVLYFWIDGVCSFVVGWF